MACGATLSLKRRFDPLHSPSQRSPKRRCMPMTISPATPPTKPHQMTPSQFGEVSTKLTNEQIAAHISAEIKRMQRRKQLAFPQSHSPPPGSGLMSPTETSHQSPSSTSPSTFYNALSPSKKEIPLFTFRQVSLVCERMLKEREQQIRQEYDKVLSNKLAEQYEAFLKFNHDQLQRRYAETPASYVS